MIPFVKKEGLQPFLFLRESASTNPCVALLGSGFIEKNSIFVEIIFI
jgi:hypothetical protein